MRTLTLLLCCLLLAGGAFAKNHDQITGVISNSSGKPVAGAAVTMEQAGKVRMRTITNTGGIYAFSGLETGYYELRISMPGYESLCYLQVHPGKEERTLELNATLEGEGKWGASIQVRIYSPSYKAAPPQTVPKEIAGGKGSGGIAGAVKDEKGEPVLNCIVSATQGGILRSTTVTDYDGAYVLRSLAAGRYDIKFTYQSKQVIHNNVPVTKHNLIVLNARITTGVSLKEVEVHKYRKPMIDARSPGASMTRTSEDLERAPVRSAADIASLSAPAYSDKKEGILLGSGSSGTSKSMEVSTVFEGKSGFVAPPEGASYVPVATPAPKAGMLTSGEINDFSKWTLWEDISMEELKTYRSTWPFLPERRFTVLLKSAEGKPLCNARVVMNHGGDKVPVWEAVTDNTGKAELWDGMYNAIDTHAALSATIIYNGQNYAVSSLKEFSKGANIISTRQPCNAPNKLDIAFIVDATGSMQDEINYLKAELTDILGKVKDSLPSMQVHTGCVFYRDLNDTYVAKISDLKPDFSQTLAFIRDNNADGGDDFPEAVDVALQQGLDGLHWRDDAVARIAFLILDAPPHSDAATVKRMQDLAYQYAKRGIRLVPVVCSGSDKSTEYLMRSLALATNGTYLFLTNHSGIGGSHTEPTTDKYDVEYLNGLIFRVIYQCSYIPACANNPVIATSDTASLHQKLPSDSTGKNNELVWKYYPNPTSGILHIEHRNTAGEMYICDISGKAIMRFNADPSGMTTVDVSNYPSGIYFIRYHYSPEHWVDGKFVVVH